MHYQSNGKITRSLWSVSLSFRTRQPTATLLHAEKDSDHLTVSLLDSLLLMELQTGADSDHPKVTVQSQGPVSDGQWHTVELSMENHSLQTSRWVMTIDGDKNTLTMSKTAAGELHFLREGADIFLGGVNEGADTRLSGCLGPVELGGLSLPFHDETQLNFPRPQEEQFRRVNSNARPRYGCWGVSVCEPNPCGNQGVCEDLFDSHHCACDSEWTGPRCEESANTCVSNPCINGNCSNQVGGFRCACDPGFTGEQCELEMDLCEGNSCSNGSTCLKGLQSYSCLCPQNMTGLYCE